MMMNYWAFYFLCLTDQNIPNRHAYTVKMEIDGKPYMTKLDTAGDFSINEQKRIFGKVCTQPSDYLKSNAKDIQG